MKVAPLSQYEAETNKRILYANLLLEMSSGPEQPDQVHRTGALTESCLIQILAAYYALLEEAQRLLNLSPQPGLNAQELLGRMRRQQVYSAELERLAELELSRESWINAAKREYNKLSASPSSSKLIASPAAPQLAATDAPAPGQYALWLRELEDACHKLRDSLSES